KIIKSEDLVLVAGQAVNIWASYYIDRQPLLKKYLPFSSLDFDFLGNRQQAREIHKLLGGKLEINKTWDSSPQAAILFVDNLRIDFLVTVFGVDENSVISNAISFVNGFKVSHPFDLFKAKLRNFVRLPQEGRQDQKHLEMLILIVQQYLIECLEEKQQRIFFNLIEQLVALLCSDEAIFVAVEKNIPMKQCLDVDFSSLEKEFTETRLPQIMAKIQNSYSKW
ncbi:MAG: hypothetical protein ACRC80_19290, partial [Waterburya sp.]